MPIHPSLLFSVAIVSAAAERIREATGAAVVILHYAKKDGEDFRGSGAILGNFEGLLQAKRDGDAGELVIERLKGFDGVVDNTALIMARDHH